MLRIKKDADLIWVIKRACKNLNVQKNINHLEKLLAKVIVVLKIEKTIINYIFNNQVL